TEVPRIAEASSRIGWAGVGGASLEGDRVADDAAIGSMGIGRGRHIIDGDGGAALARVAQGIGGTEGGRIGAVVGIRMRRAGEGGSWGAVAEVPAVAERRALARHRAGEGNGTALVARE